MSDGQFYYRSDTPSLVVQQPRKMADARRWLSYEVGIMWKSRFWSRTRIVGTPHGDDERFKRRLLNELIYRTQPNLSLKSPPPQTPPQQHQS